MDHEGPQLDRFFEFSPDLLCIAGFDGFLKRVNQACLSTLGYTRDELQDRAFLDLVHPDDRRRTFLEAKRLARGGEPSRFENRCRCGDGSYRSLIWKAVAVAAHQQIYAIARPKSGELARTTGTLSAIVEGAGAAIIAVDSQGNVTMWNPAAERIYGWSQADVMGGPPPYLSGVAQQKEYQARAAEVLQGKALRDLKARRHRKDGKEVEVDLSIAPMRDEKGKVCGQIGIAIDVTEKKKLEVQLLRAQRMNSLGSLAGGMAHDLNNVLAPVLMGVQLLRTKPHDSSNEWVFDTIEASARRGSGLAKQILTFARGLEGERSPVQIRHLIRELEGVLQQTFSKGITIVADVPKDLWTIHADSTQLHQVMLNLSINARDAMGDDGLLTITAANMVLDRSFAATHPEAKTGAYVAVRITDTGGGIPSDIVGQIFEPFFTTKEVGKGTGIGLSTSLAIIKGHSGFIDVQSQAGKGTSFTVYLPATESQDVIRHRQVAPAIPMGQGELILIVDDEASVRNIAKATLEAYNYRVITAEDGADGVASFVEHKAEIRLVLTDNNMPVMDGVAMLRAIQKLRPDAKVISASGSNISEAKRSLLDGFVTCFLPKPFTAEELLRAVKQTLSV
ncbi:MAG TPA: PAS domain S-box protein [Terriglobia bacterium]|nr:PAS domain S-box protein [Terriglobia bacterium]